MFRLWEQGQTPAQIAETLGLSRVSVRRLVRRFRDRGVDSVTPDYHPAHPVSALDSDLAKATIRMRREHPTWGAGLIRVLLLQEAPPGPVPSVRTLQRWLLRADLAPAPAGRRPEAASSRATAPHQTWQMDAKEQIKIRNYTHVS
jgi:hypothetical protein